MDLLPPLYGILAPRGALVLPHGRLTLSDALVTARNSEIRLHERRRIALHLEGSAHLNGTGTRNGALRVLGEFLEQGGAIQW